MKAGYGMTELLMAVFAKKIFRRERDLLVLILTSGCWMKNGKSHVTQRTATLTRQDLNKYSDGDEMAGLRQK